MAVRPLSTRVKASAVPRAVLLGAIALVGVLPAVASANEADLTQFGPKTYGRGTGPQTGATETFRAADGPGRLLVSGEGPGKLTIRLNGAQVLNLRRLDGQTSSTPVDLDPNNTMTVALSPGSRVTVRVKQQVTADPGTTAVGIYGLQVSDFQRQLRFYQHFGLHGVIEPAGPHENTPDMARVLGIDNPPYYYLDVALHWINTPGVGAAADTVKFTTPYRSDPPYAKLNHIGFTHVTYGTTDLDGAVAYLRSVGAAGGVSSVTDPAGPMGSRYAFVRDGDGTYFRLIEDNGGSGQASPTALTDMKSITLNASDLDASKEFLKLFGFTQSTPVTESARPGSREAKAWGFPQGFSRVGYDLVNPANPSAPKIELRRWLSPYDPEPAYPLPMNHIGIDRMVFNSSTPSVIAAANSLVAAGVNEVGPPAQCCYPGSTFGISLYTGPDGIIVEFGGPYHP